MKSYKFNRILQFLFPFFFISGIILLIIGINDKVTVNINYEENNAINYKVYLKENPFFEEPFLGENRTYIASLIDYVDADFNYDIKYSRPFNGHIKYKFVALVQANKKNSPGYYWNKEYDLSEEKTMDLENNTNVTISDNVKVNYAKYNSVLNQFKKEYGLETNGELKILMRVTNTADFEKIDHPVEVNSEISITIPLLEQAIDVSINKETNNNKNVITIREKSHRLAYLIFKITGTILMFTSIFGIINTTRYSKRFQKRHTYMLALNRILENYDSIIANVKNEPDISNYKEIEVDQFEELLDVYNEVRMPINYYQDKTGKESTFIIINNDVAWIYRLKDKKRTDKDES